MTDAQRAAGEALIAESRREEWLTVKEFAALVKMNEHSVRELLRKGKLSKKYRVERITDGPKARIRIVVPLEAA